MAKSLVGDADLPVAVVINSLELPHGHRLPVIEGADEMDALSPWKEFTKYPAAFLFIVVKTIIKVAIGKLLQGDIASLSDGAFTGVGELHTTTDALFVRLEPRVICC